MFIKGRGSGESTKTSIITEGTVLSSILATASDDNGFERSPERERLRYLPTLLQLFDANSEYNFPFSTYNCSGKLWRMRIRIARKKPKTERRSIVCRTKENRTVGHVIKENLLSLPVAAKDEDDQGTTH